MKQLHIRGTSFVTPELGQSELEHALAKLGVAAVFSEADIHQTYMEIAGVYGAWLAEEESKEVSSVATALRRTGKNLIEASMLLSGRQTGLRNQVELEVTSRLIEIMGQDPTVEDSEKLIAAFQREAARVGEACLIAYADLDRKALNDGRAPMVWYDEFTAILLRIAKKAGIDPNLNKDRIEHTRGGWLFNAAQALEPFLHRYMRSPSPEACGKRLERSCKRLLNSDRQNPNRR
jgi:hypothetical protein